MPLAYVTIHLSVANDSSIFNDNFLVMRIVDLKTLLGTCPLIFSHFVRINSLIIYPNFRMSYCLFEFSCILKHSKWILYADFF